jgi:hypothetical protein
MLRERRLATRVAITIVAVLILAAAFYQRAALNLNRIDYRNSNFVFFLMAVRLFISGGDPYDSTQWLAEHDANGVDWRPNKIFPYPLPLAFVMAPLGLLSLGDAYLGWQLISEACIVASMWFLLERRKEPTHQRLLVPLALIMLFFGPVYLTLQLGALGALTLLAITAAIATLDQEHSIAAGILLSLTLLKPPQGMPIVFLAGIWCLSRRDWRAIAGLGLGAVGMVLIGMIGDPLWLLKFATSSQVVIGRTLGVQSNAFGLAYAACSGDLPCMWQCGGIAVVIILAAGGRYLWLHGRDLSPWEALALIIPIAFVATLYLWSYDQILYVIPVVWIVLRLIDRTRSYVASFLFLSAMVLVSMTALVIQANTHSDLTSIVTTVLVLGGYALVHSSKASSGSVIPAC